MRFPECLRASHIKEVVPKYLCQEGHPSKIFGLPQVPPVTHPQPRMQRSPTSSNFPYGQSFLGILEGGDDRGKTFIMTQLSDNLRKSAPNRMNSRCWILLERTFTQNNPKFTHSASPAQRLLEDIRQLVPAQWLHKISCFLPFRPDISHLNEFYCFVENCLGRPSIENPVCLAKFLHEAGETRATGPVFPLPYTHISLSERCSS